METLLAGVVQQRARIVILDLTGVRMVDSRAAQGLMQAARAAHMLGAESILTGINAELASVLVELEVDLRGLVTLGSLRSGVEYAMQRSRALQRR
jgi:anti-anti-sigma regulatory factor